MNMNLPSDLINFLEQKKGLDYVEDEAIPQGLKLLNLEELEITEIWVDATEYEGFEIVRQAYYELKAVNLTGDCKNYGAFALLMWLPELNSFGAWDDDHWRVTLFPNASWIDICRNPIPYINAQWEEDCCEVGEVYDPSKKYSLIIGWPY